MSSNGTFISLEGGEATGKSTQARLLVTRLESFGLEVVVTREPGGTQIGEAVRGILQHDTAGVDVGVRTEVLLFAASRAQHVEEVIRPALARGAWVVCDRFVDSSLVYQGIGRGEGLDAVGEINAYAMAGCMPTRTLVFDLPVAESTARLRARTGEEGGDRIEREGDAFFASVREGFLTLAKQHPERSRVIQATGSVDSVHAAVWAEIEDLLS